MNLGPDLCACCVLQAPAGGAAGAGPGNGCRSGRLPGAPGRLHRRGGVLHAHPGCARAGSPRKSVSDGTQCQPGSPRAVSGPHADISTTSSRPSIQLREGVWVASWHACTLGARDEPKKRPASPAKPITLWRTSVLVACTVCHGVGSPLGWRCYASSCNPSVYVQHELFSTQTPGKRSKDRPDPQHAPAKNNPLSAGLLLEPRKSDIMQMIRPATASWRVRRRRRARTRC